MNGEPFCWHCRRCGRLLATRDIVQRRDRQWMHWDLLTLDWCGPVQKVGVR